MRSSSSTEPTYTAAPKPADGAATIVVTRSGSAVRVFFGEEQPAAMSSKARKSFVSLVYSFSMQSSLLRSGEKAAVSPKLVDSFDFEPSANINGKLLYLYEKSRQMNEKDIQSFSLATLIDVCGAVPETLLRRLSDRVARQRADEIDIDLFRYPTRIDAFVILFCSKGSGSLLELTRHTAHGEFDLRTPAGSIIQAESTKEIALHAVICEEEFIRRINIDIRLLSQLFLHVEKQPCLKLDEKEWTGITGRSRNSAPRVRRCRRTSIPPRSYVRSSGRWPTRCAASSDVTSKRAESGRSRRAPQRRVFQQFMNILG